MADITNPNAIAQPKLFTLKPSIMASTTMMRTAFITQTKSPKVKMVIGSVRIIKMGLTSTLTSAKSAATNTALQKFLTSTPFSKLEVAYTETLLSNQAHIISLRFC